MNKINILFGISMIVILITVGYYITEKMATTDMIDIEYVGTPIINDLDLVWIAILTLLVGIFIALFGNTGIAGDHHE